MNTLLAQAMTTATSESARYPGEIAAPDAPLLSLVICTLDEHEAIGGVLHELHDVLKGIDHEIIVVDDSRDERTGDVVSAYSQDNPQVRLLRRHAASGLSSAAIKGWDAAKGRFLAIMDGDGQHDPALIKTLLDALRDSDADLAVASRYLEDSRSGLQGMRHHLSRAGTWLTDATLGVPLADPLSGCFAMTGAWYAQVRRQLSGLGFKILIDVVASGTRRPRTAEVPTTLRARAGGESKLDTRVILDLITLLIEKRTRGRFTARAILHGMAFSVALCAQWLALGVLVKLSAPMWPALLLSACIGLAGRYGMALLTTSRSLRPRGARRFGLHGVAFAFRRWTDIPLNAGLAIALCNAHCPWGIAVLAGALLAECRYHVGTSAGAKA